MNEYLTTDVANVPYLIKTKIKKHKKKLHLNMVSGTLGPYKAMAVAKC